MFEKIYIKTQLSEKRQFNILQWQTIKLSLREIEYSGNRKSEVFTQQQRRIMLDGTTKVLSNPKSLISQPHFLSAKYPQLTFHVLFHPLYFRQGISRRNSAGKNNSTLKEVHD